MNELSEQRTTNDARATALADELTPMPPRMPNRGRAVRWLAWIGALVTIAYVVLLGAVLVLAAFESRRPRLICLMYHRFATPGVFDRCSDDDRVYTMATSRFEEQMTELVRLGYHAVGIDAALDFVERGTALPEHALLISIDDGYRNALTLAGPILQRHGLRATIFVSTDPAARVFHSKIPDSQRISDDELRTLDANAFDVGAHGCTHCDLRSLSDADLLAELRNSRATLERVTGRRIRAMAAPGNWYDERVQRFAGEAGYEAMFVSDPGSIRHGDDAFSLHRLMVSGTWREATFEQKMSPWGLARRRTTSAVHRIRPTLPPAVADGIAELAETLIPMGLGMAIGAAAVAGVAVCVLCRSAHLRPTKQRGLPTG